MALDFSNDRSIFAQVMEMIENDIVRGILNEDEQSMSTNELARVLSINPNTAAKALSALMADGILYKKRGVGMFVSKGANEKILDKRRSVFLSDYLSPLLREAKVIGITKQELINIIMEEDI